MKRKIINNFNSWVNSKQRKPLILRGARQVGKTYILEELGRQHFQKVHLVNFERMPQFKSLFEADLVPQRILEQMKILLNAEINIEKDLIIFDEIQECPQAITSLKYFCEEMPESFICAAGSLLGVMQGPYSFPVGKVEFLYLHPMSFEEFLIAVNDEVSASFIQDYSVEQIIPFGIHDHLLKQFYLYLFTGGLPEIVALYVKNMDNIGPAFYSELRQRQNDLMNTYLADMVKHSGKTNAMHIRRVWDSIPSQLAKENKKYTFKNVIPGKKSFADLASPLDWIENAGLSLKTRVCSVPSNPLPAYTKENSFKMYHFDTGLLNAQSALSIQTILNLSEQEMMHKGYILENFVAQELSSLGFAEHKNLYYWSGDNFEIEFLLPLEDKIIPLEVKSRLNSKAKSLQFYIQKFAPPFAIMMTPQLSNNTKFKESKIFNLPIYMAGQLERISSLLLHA